MVKIKTATRLAITIGLIAATLIWSAMALEVIPNPNRQMFKTRVGLTRSIGLSVTSYAENRRTLDLDTFLQRAVKLDDNIQSLGVKLRNRKGYLAVAGPHVDLWNPEIGKDPARQLSVQILTNGREWGELEVVFVPHESFSWFRYPVGIIAFIAAAMALLSWLVMSKTFKYLNPSNVVPERVRSALDSLAEGLVLVDKSGEIAHANQAFEMIVQHDPENDYEILGSQLSAFGWTVIGEAENPQFPWELCLETQERICGEILELEFGAGSSKRFVVNTTPIMGKSGDLRGVLASFDDVTELESKNAELALMIDSLRSSRDEISKQNEQLNFLASYDPLTQCMNRRSFFGKFQKLWAEKESGNLAIMMLDVDHFKAVNDNHGHSVGDAVLKATGKALRDVVGDRGLVCRYGGEEFIVLIPGAEFDDCVDFANEIRVVLSEIDVQGVRFTASFGISSRAFGSMDAQHMLDQADEALYIAKRAGRNQVVRFDERHNYQVEEKGSEATAAASKPEGSIPYSAVTGLLSALSFRCSNTAEHSIRVADLCVAIGSKLMNKRDLYYLEIAALLHDIGKIGVPDAILHKPGPLTNEEWKIMQKHDEIGVEIVQSAFDCEAITAAIASHHFCFSVRNKGAKLQEVGDSIPLASRIISVCDAYDAMTNDRVYRTAMPELEALQELTRYCPNQFDPMVVSKLVDYVRDGDHRSNQQVAEIAYDSRIAASIGHYIEELNNAVASQDVDTIKAVVESLKQGPGEVPVSDVANRLDDAINAHDDMEKVLDLANEVMNICRASRSAFVDSAENIIENDG